MSSSDEEKLTRNTAKENRQILTANRSLKQHLFKHRAKKIAVPHYFSKQKRTNGTLLYNDLYLWKIRQSKFLVTVTVSFNPSIVNTGLYTNIYDGSLCNINFEPHYHYCDLPECDCRKFALRIDHTKTLISQYYRIRPFISHTSRSAFFELRFLIADVLFMNCNYVTNDEIILEMVKNHWKIIGPTINGLKALLRSKFSHFQSFDNMKNVGGAKRTLQDLCILKMKKHMIRQVEIEHSIQNWNKLYQHYFIRINPTVFRPFNKKIGMKKWTEYLSVSFCSQFSNPKLLSYMNNYPIAQSTMPFFQFAPLHEQFRGSK